MDYGIKVSKQGFNVMNTDSKRANRSRNEKPLPHLLYAFALPYLLGAKIQVKRYQIAASTLKERPVCGVYECIYESSTLFEDLSTVGKYVEKCGNVNELHQLWSDVRNHIRHDIREEFDNENSPRKNKRLGRLKLDPKLQTNMGFTINSIKVGGTIIEIRQINTYIDWAEKIISEVLNEAKAHSDLK